MKRILIQYTYMCNSKATLFGQRLGIQRCNLVIESAGSRFGDLRKLSQSLTHNCADLVGVQYFGEFNSTTHPINYPI